MISVRGVARAAVAGAVVLLAVGAARADTHAPWPTDWNNWNDPALWVTVGNPGNPSDTRYATPGYGSVGYTFNMGKFEVTAGQYCEFLNKVAGVDTYGLYNTNMWSTTYFGPYGCKIERFAGAGTLEAPYQYRVAQDYANRPVNGVSWGDAARFANWLTNGQKTGAQDANTTEDGSYYLNGAMTNTALMAVTRKTVAQGGRYYIPTEDEWYKAAYYDGGSDVYYDYPMGTNVPPSNILGDPIDPGNNATFAPVGDYTIGSPYWRTEVGAHENSDSPYGTFDQGGNVLEWNEAITEWGRGHRGGSFYIGTGFYLNAMSRDSDDATVEGFAGGFRVAGVPEPATLSLLAVGGLVALRRRR